MLSDLKIKEAVDFINKSSKNSSIYIGCDSQIFRNSKSKIKKARYSTVIVVHMNSNNGCKIFHDSVIMDDFDNLKTRLMNEVNFAINTAMKIVDNLDGRKLEIHLDLNGDQTHESNVAVKEALGWVAGMGLVGKIKPDAFAATYAADHSVRKYN